MTTVKQQDVLAGQLSLRTDSTSGSRLKILSLTTAYPNSVEPGMGMFIRSRVRAMKAFADVRVVAPVSRLRYSDWRKIWSFADDIPDTEQDGSLTILHPRWVYPPLAGASNGAALFLQLVRPLMVLRRSFAFQLIDAHFGYPEGPAAALLARFLGVPFTITLRGCEVAHGAHSARRRQMAWAFRRASRVIAVSDRLKQFAISLGASPDRAFSIPNGVDSTVFCERNRLECRQRHGLAPEARIILSAGNLIELKGHHRLVRSLKQMLDQGADARLVIAGGAGRAESYEQTLRKEIADLGLDSRVTVLGEVSQQAVAELMCAADVLCLASSREGWPNVVHEAMSCGTPVVATDVGAIPEMIPSDDFGFIVPVNDVAAMSQALLRALAKPWDRSAIATRAQSRSWTAAARDVVGEMECAVAEDTERRQRHSSDGHA